MIRKTLAASMLLLSIAAFSQKTNTSPYSFFGIGDKNNGNTAEQVTMGGIGAAFADSYHLNLANPASLSSLQFTAYTIGIESIFMNAKDNVNSENARATYISYLAVGVPLAKNAGLSFGLLPNTSVGYSLVSNVLDTEGLTEEATVYQGEGGTNKVFLGLGFQLFKGFSVGVQGNYIFGKIQNNIINQERDVSLATKYETNATLKGLTFNTGFQYKTKINDKFDLHLGGNVELEGDIDADGKELLYSVSLINFELPRDTILNVDNKGSLNIPLKSTLGIGVGQENKWFAGVDYSFQKKLNIEGTVFNNFSKIAYDDYSQIALGGFYIPKLNSITSYWERVTYRAGVKFEKTGLLVDPTGAGTNFTAIDNFGISFGIGLPMNNQLSNLNLGLELGKRGKKDQGLVQENYINFRLSFSLNDKWFKKLEIF
jgi:hypothetical protein